MSFSALDKSLYLYSCVTFNSFKVLINLNIFRRFNFDGHKVCQLVGSFIVNKLASLISKSNIGLHHDEGLEIFQNVSKPKIKKKKKEVNILKGCSFSITIQCFFQTKSFLDVTFYLDKNVYKLSRKENNKPIYVNRYSKKSTNILRQLPKFIFLKRHVTRIYLTNW